MIDDVTYFGPRTTKKNKSSSGDSPILVGKISPMHKGAMVVNFSAMHLTRNIVSYEKRGNRNTARNRGRQNAHLLIIRFAFQWAGLVHTFTK